MAQPNSDDNTVPEDEFTIIGRLASRFTTAAHDAGCELAATETGIGDDAALLEPTGDRQLWATDLVVDGVHVDRRFCSWGDIGYKAVMVTVSDLGAMGGRPTHLLVSVAAPAGSHLDDLMEGVAEAATESHCAVVGGDLSGSGTLVVSVAACGVLDGPGPALLRSGARPGDTLLVTGPLGGSAVGLRKLRGGAPGNRESGNRESDRTSGVRPETAYRRPVARIAEGILARQAGARAAIDVSDGFWADLGHLARASGVGAEIDDVPVAPGASEEEALSGGEDYELILSTPDPQRLIAAFAEAGLRPPVVIGRCTDHAGTLRLRGGEPEAPGWRHNF